MIHWDGCDEFDRKERLGGLKEIHVLERPSSTHYPYDFDPTFHRYRLDEPQTIKKSQNIFVCSMADMFGGWVPDEWITDILKACEAAPQHRYLFLTKNATRYIDLAKKLLLPDDANFWFGSTATTEKMTFWWSKFHNTFVSIEPIHGAFERIVNPVKKVDWVIIGAETGNRKGKITPERAWIDNIVMNCRETGTPVFMKDNLREIWGEALIQEYPWEVKTNERA